MNQPLPPVRPSTKWTHQYPELGTGPLPHAPNISRAYFEAEREKVFKRAWLVVGREDELPRPGSYIVKQLHVVESSVLLARGQDGVVRAFHNVCRHRGNKVVMGEGEKRGDAPAFMCGFHGWTYDLEGRLIQVPDEEDFFGLDKCQLGLKPIHCEVWRGFIFVNVADRPRVSLLEQLDAEWAADVGRYPFEAFERTCVFNGTVNCNWKIGLDAFQEGYHIVALHRRSAYDPFASRSDPYAHLQWVKLYPEGTRRMSFPANLEFVPAASVLKAVQYTGNNVYAYQEEGRRNLPGVNPGGFPNWSFDINILFPHVQLLMSDAFFGYQRFWPIAEDRMYWEADIYMPRATKPSERIAQQNQAAALKDVVREDLSTLENTQSVLKSGAITHMQLNDSEIAVRYSYKKVQEWIDAP
jgi:phenylpropionate dioxygenase-like ring-hydroxylating dioxygenase large terminal subunit